ncbi:MAG: TetR/AcrR family transcriptional regulator [Alkalibacterium sp.]|nr:MAG: TetR/AcrR family transcriptional regulator [Alkalibacterium sp.]
MGHLSDSQHLTEIVGREDNMAKKKDLRVLKTHKAIYTAFFTLLQKKDYTDITIQDIADEALINRSTFYAYFHDKDDLVEQIIEQKLDSIRAVMQLSLLTNDNEVKLMHIQMVLTQLLEQIKEDKDTYVLILSIIDKHILTDKFKGIVTDAYQDILSRLRIMESDMEVPVELIIDYSLGILFMTVNWWLKNDCDYPEDQLARLIMKLVGNANLTVLGISVI